MIDGITIISQSPREISILYPPDGSNTFFLYYGVIALLIAGYIYFKWRNWLWCLVALSNALVALVLAGWSLTAMTTINASADTGVLIVHHTVAGISTGQHTYPLSEIEGFRIGFTRGGRYLYADLTDGYTSQLLPAGYQGGYKHAADALNSFLGSEEETQQQTPSQ